MLVLFTAGNAANLIACAMPQMREKPGQPLVIDKAAIDALGLREVTTRVFAAGVAVRTSTPEAFASFVKSEVGKWAGVVKASGAEAD